MHNFEVAGAFFELADLLEFKEESIFKIRAYRRAGKIIAGLGEPVEDIYRRGGLKNIPGIGRNIAAKIGELVEKGKMDKLEALRAEIPRGLMEIISLPGIGPKKAGLLFQGLGVKSLSDLEQAAKDRKVRLLKGMSARTEMGIINNIKLIRERAGKFPIGVAAGLAGELTEYLERVAGVEKVTAAGSVRRWQEVVEDVDLLAASVDAESCLEAMVYNPRTKEVMERTGNYIKVVTWWGIPVELKVVEPQFFYYELLWKTGSKKHLEQLCRFALQKQWELTPAGMKNGDGAVIVPVSEEEAYSLLGLQYIPPELREGRGEIESAEANALPVLIDDHHIRGDLHVHSDWSDGSASIEGIIQNARRKGYGYVAVTDHSHSLKVAGGLSSERLAEQFAYIDELNRKLDGITVLKGIEVDILAKGGLDFADHVLAQADVVVASVHSGFNQSRETITARILEAVENRHVDIIGHLTGRLLGRRESYQVDVERVLEEAGKCGKIMEINASPERLDLNYENARKAVDAGAYIAINTDAHDLARMDDIRFGVAQARRAGLEPGNVVNTLEIDDLMSLLKKK